MAAGLGERHRKTLETQRFLCDLCLTLTGICYIIIKRLFGRSLR